MNILRLMGQRGLLGTDAPVRHSAKRRRIKTVIQKLIYRAARLIHNGRKAILGLGRQRRGGRRIQAAVRRIATEQSAAGVARPDTPAH